MALLAVLPLLFVFYLRYILAVSRLRPHFSLGKFESTELQRTTLLYEQAARRLKVCRERRERPAWRAWGRQRDGQRQQSREELEDLESYARDLRARIVGLRARPLARYKSWVHRVSAKSALGRSLGCYALVLALLLAAYCYFEPILWAGGIDASFKAFVLWQAVKARMLLANWMAANSVAIAMPLLYLIRRVTLYRALRPQVLDLKAFAATDPDYLIAHRPDEALGETAAIAGALPDDRDCFSVLEVSPSATIEEVKQAYKALVKKSHPDRVQEMSPSFVKLADVEMKRLNAAYEQALACLREGMTGVGATENASYRQ